MRTAACVVSFLLVLVVACIATTPIYAQQKRSADQMPRLQMQPQTAPQAAPRTVAPTQQQRPYSGGQSVIGGGQSFTCSSDRCTCNGHADCNDMFKAGVCGADAECYDQSGGGVVCTCERR